MPRAETVLSEDDGAIVDALMARDRGHFESCGCHTFMRPVEKGDRLIRGPGMGLSPDTTHMQVTLIAPGMRVRREMYAPKYRGQLVHLKLGPDSYVEEIRRKIRGIPH